LLAFAPEFCGFIFPHFKERSLPLRDGNLFLERQTGMRIFLWVAFFMALAVCVPAFAAEKDSAYSRVMRAGTIRCGYLVWPPYIAKDPNTGAMSGMTYDLVEQLGKTLNLKIEWTVEYALGQQVETLKSSKVDILVHDGPWTRSAMPYLGYSKAQFYAPVYLYTAGSRAKEFAGQPADTLNRPDFSFSAMDGDLSLDLKNFLFPQAQMFTISSASDPSVMMENVISGKADALILDPLSAKDFNGKREEKLVTLNPEKPLAVYPVVISVLPEETALLGLLDRGIGFMHNTGLTEHILRTYDQDLETTFLPAAEYRQEHP